MTDNKTYKYYTPYRWPGPGAVPKEDLIEVSCFDTRKEIKELGIQAYGWAKYSRKLTAHEVYQYELVEAE